MNFVLQSRTSKINFALQSRKKQNKFCTPIAHKQNKFCTPIAYKQNKFTDIADYSSILTIEQSNRSNLLEQFLYFMLLGCDEILGL
ncbi:MAG: hypothetical protein DRR08_32635 [Candidatus Parabeggiatoa sp. nov. 2]|nr:MAG: hypothetical protein DRR08_32635 [Gammaproteobacteria bacterium]